MKCPVQQSITGKQLELCFELCVSRLDAQMINGVEANKIKMKVKLKLTLC